MKTKQKLKPMVKVILVWSLMIIAFSFIADYNVDRIDSKII